MNRFVLDNSVAMRWLLASRKKADQDYAESVLIALSESIAIVPNLWHLEVANVLLSAEKHGDLNAAETEGFTAQLKNLPIEVDSLTAQKALSSTQSLAKAFNLSSYDASYLELAVRRALPISTLDKNLQRAARKASVKIYMS